MSAFTVHSLAGDSIVIGSDPDGFHLGVIPASPPDDDAIDVFTLGLSFSSVTRVLACLRGGQPVEMNDGKFRISLVSGTPTLDFELQHRPGTRYPVRLDPEAAAAFEGYLSRLLSGSPETALPAISPAIVRGKVPRNSPCPCGSGKKYKKCCLVKESSSSLPEQLSFVEGSSDPIVKQIVEDVRNETSALSDPQFWNYLGGALGSGGDHSRALAAFRRGSEIEPDDPAIQLNIAVTQGVLGNHEAAFSILDQVADDYPRRAIVVANLLQDVDRYAEAIPYYEAAIEEEPDFFLPYARLFSSLERTSSPLIDYWMNRAIEAVPRSPEIAKLYCYRLLRERRIPELAEADWIDSLRSEHGRPDMIGRSSDDPRNIVEAQLFRSIGLISASHATDELVKAVATLEAADPAWHLCDVAKLLAASAANLGIAPATAVAYDRICSGCREERIGIAGPLSTYLARALRVAGEYEDSIVCAEDALAESAKDLTALGEYWWCLDEVGRLDEAIEVGQRLYRLNPSEENLEYNLGFLSGKKGSLGLARNYYEKAIERDPRNWRAVENLSFALLRDGELDSAESHWRRYLELFEEAAREAAAYLDGDGQGEEADPAAVEVHIRRKREKWSRLRQAAQSSIGSVSYALDLTSLNESSEPLVGSHSTIGRAEFSIDRILEALSEPDRESAIELRHQLRMQERGDMSALVASLSSEVPIWSRLPPEAQTALLEGERRISERVSVDHAPDIVSFAKAVEIVLRRLVFDEFATEQQSDLDLEKHVQVALQDKFRQAHSFVRFVDRGQHLELGAMTHALKLCRGKTGQKVLLLGRFKQFIEERLGWHELLTDASLADLGALSDRRNPAAHSANFGEEGAREARALALAELRRLGSSGV